MFALKGHQLGSKKKVGLEKQGVTDEMDDEVIKARFQEIGPRMTVKMRWIRRGGLGETGDERTRREADEKASGGGMSAEFGEGAGRDGEDVEMGGVGGAAVDGAGEGEDDEREAARAIGLVDGDDDSQPNFDFGAVAAAAEASSSASATKPAKAPRGPRTVPRKRKLPYHALLRPPPSPSPPPGFQDSEPVPLPPKNGKGDREKSVLSTVGKTWHAGKVCYPCTSICRLRAAN